MYDIRRYTDIVYSLHITCMYGIRRYMHTQCTQYTHSILKLISLANG